MKLLVYGGLAAVVLTAGLLVVLFFLPLPRDERDGEVLLTLSKTELYRDERTLTYTIVNDSRYVVSFGEPYDIQIKKNGEWVSVEWMKDRVWILILYMLEPGQVFSRKVELPQDVETGTYRLVKEVMVEATGEKMVLTAEFEVVS
ncbi:MAG: hypothetical protein QXG69_00290 [Candidatus Caldarchaeum sp.]|uniref:Bacterial Ig-like domain-containing protein n=1 Tax=Caldiarchaeum subterraneum TaxID=311458 RepID=A0A7C5LDY4_CALS0